MPEQEGPDPRDVMIAPFRTTFGVSNVHVIGDEEERWPEDHPDPRSRGKVKRPASISLLFDQQIGLPLAEADIRLQISQFLAQNIEPDLAIQMFEFGLEEAKRVKATMKEQPLRPVGFTIARGEEDVARTAEHMNKLRGSDDKQA